MFTLVYNDTYHPIATRVFRAMFPTREAAERHATADWKRYATAMGWKTDAPPIVSAHNPNCLVAHAKNGTVAVQGLYLVTEMEMPK